MGRPKLNKAVDEVVAQQKRWADTRNKTRRENYARNAQYRESVNRRNRDSYREKNQVELRDCRENVTRLSEFGTMRKVAIDMQDGQGFLVYERLTFTVKELAEILGSYHQIVLYRWHKEGKFPRPNVALVDDNNIILENSHVYTDEQVRHLMLVLGAHQAEKQYLHNTDTATIRSLAKVIEEVV